MRILLTGKTGQVGYELQRSLQAAGEIVALDRSQMDLASPARIRDVIRTVKPDLIVNPAAYTAVDRAESEPELALRINAEAPAIMAEEARKLGAAMIHYSTDYVFNGSKNSPYTEEDLPDPQSMYGRSKLAGECALRDAGIPHVILRISWVYGMRGRNFLMTVLRLAQERDELHIVADQHGTPTWCRTVADATAQIVAQAAAAPDRPQWWREKTGTYALTAHGQTTWHGFTQAVLAQAELAKPPAVVPIASKDYPAAAARPQYSVLSCARLERAFGLKTPGWAQALNLCMGRT